jgi:DNA (cytosine-5)-methyltransferase 3A
MNVLSLFDGMSCGRVALDRLGIPVDNYYASEIDKYAIQVSQANYPDIIQVGDVTELDTSTLPKIDLIMGGSPCQGFSFAGKQLAFDDPRSALFFEFVRCVEELKPKYFLLENVRMKKEYLDVISEYMGVEPIMINSALVSAQNRVRYYWTNIPGIEQPEQRGIVLRDILETQTDEKPVKDTKRNQRHYRNDDEKSLCMTATMYKGAGNNGMTLVQEQKVAVFSEDRINKFKETLKDDPKPSTNGIIQLNNPSHSSGRVYSPDGKSPTLMAGNSGGGKEPVKIRDVIAVDSYREVRTEEAKRLRKEMRQKTGKDHTPFRAKKLVPRDDGKVGTLTTSLTNDHKISLTTTKPKRVGTIKDGSQGDRIYSQDAKGITLNAQSGGTAGSGNMLVEDKEVYWRKLTPVECERLQTVPDNYTNHVSNTQRYKMLGNGWTIEVITHILKNMEL